MPRWMGNAMSGSEVTNWSSVGESTNIFSGDSSGISGPGIAMQYSNETREIEIDEASIRRPYAVGHQHYGLGPGPCCQAQEEIEMEDDFEEEVEEDRVSHVPTPEPEIIVIPDSPEPQVVPSVPLPPEVIMIPSDSEMEESPIRMPPVPQMSQDRIPNSDQMVPEINPSSVDPYPHCTEYWERYLARVQQSDSYQNRRNRDVPPVIQDFPPIPVNTPMGSFGEAGTESYGSNGTTQDPRASGPGVGYGVRYSAPAATWCRICGLNGHVSYFCPNQGWNNNMVGVTCVHCGKEGHRGSECPIIHPEIQFASTLTPASSPPSSSHGSFALGVGFAQGVGTR